MKKGSGEPQILSKIAIPSVPPLKHSMSKGMVLAKRLVALLKGLGFLNYASDFKCYFWPVFSEILAAEILAAQYEIPTHIAQYFFEIALLWKLAATDPKWENT